MDKLSLGENRDERMMRFNEFREEWYASHEPTNRLPEIRLTDLRSNKWAELSGQHIKAAATRCAVPMVRDFAREVFTLPTAEDTDTVGIMDDLDFYYNILYRNPIFMPYDELETFKTVTLDIGLKFLRLRQWSRRNGKMYFQVRPKLHNMQDLPLFAAALNP